MVNYTDNPTDVEEIKKDRIRWIIESLRRAIRRLPHSSDNWDRRQKIKELEDKLD